MCIVFVTVTCTRYSDKVLLRDIEVLTLHDGQYTTGRRSSRVPQVKEKVILIFMCPSSLDMIWEHLHWVASVNVDCCFLRFNGFFQTWCKGLNFDTLLSSKKISLLIISSKHFMNGN